MTAKTVADKTKNRPNTSDLRRKTGEKVRYIILIEWRFKPEIVTIEQIEEMRDYTKPKH